MVLRILRLLVPLLCSTGIALVLAASSHNAAAAADTHTGRPNQAVLALQPLPGAALLQQIGSGYLSPATAAPRPFTHVMIRWDATMPLSSSLALELRASSDGQTWTDWGPVQEDPDLWVPDDGETTYWSHVIYTGSDTRFWQLRVALQPSSDGHVPSLNRIEVNTVDGRYATPSADTGTPDSTGQASPANLSKPGVVSRTGWGCPDGQGSRVSPVYYPVKHMVIHHTADSSSLQGSEKNWSDRVRAIWSFHTYTRGWGDIGYNYLIAPSGTIYEGRAGGDDVVAFHDAANYGSMGVSMIGTYSSGTPSSAAQESLVALLAWKANQKGIDPLGRSYYYGCAISRYCDAPGAIVDNIAGHRQTRSGTECPGTALHALMPTIRNRVKDRIAGGGGTQPDNGDLVIDELEESFARSAANWYDADCGYGGHTFYTYATDRQAESTNSATWRPNIPSTGQYRVYAAIPQNCGLATPPYATRSAIYRIVYANGGYAEVRVDQNTAEQWVYLGTYTFNQGTSGAVELYDLTGEPYSQRKVVFFDSIKWVPETQSRGSIELLNVRYDRNSVAVGELLKITFTVRNNSNVTIFGQDPQAGTRPDGSFDPQNGYVYDEGECFLGAEGQNYPTYPKQTERFRLTLGPLNRSVTCAGNTGGYPWRWGIDGALAPGETRDIVGYVRFRTPGEVTLQAGVIQEYVRYYASGVAQTSITITPEQLSPVAADYDNLLQPLAHVYRLGNVPDNLLARTRNPLSLPRGDYIGGFAWDGRTIDWGEGGPLGLNDSFLIEQTRLFIAPVSGEYVFRVTSDDGSWLWINGQELIVNHGLHTARTITGTLYLNAGLHVLSFKYFERSGDAVAGYNMQVPGDSTFGVPRDGLGGGAMRFGAIFAAIPDLALAADDLGGSGAARIRYSWDGNTWTEVTVGDGGTAPVLRLGKLVNGDYVLRYQAIDRVGNTTPVRQIAFTVNTELEVQRVYLPLALR